MAGTTKLMTAGGGGVNIQPASSIASDVTVNVPSQNCTLGIQGPAFSASKVANQSAPTAATWTKLIFDTKAFDTANCFDATTNYRCTPNVAGYYNFGVDIQLGVNLSAGNYIVCNIYKNGSSYSQLCSANGVAAPQIAGTALVYMNGTTDYVEMYEYQNVSSGATLNFQFYGVLVRAA